MPTVIPSRRRIRLLALPAVAAGVLLLAACGSATATPSSSSDAGADDAFATCMAENGVTAPTGGPDGGSGGGTPPTGTPPAGGTPPDGSGGAMQAPPGVDSATWEAALEACASVAPAAPGT